MGANPRSRRRSSVSAVLAALFLVILWLPGKAATTAPDKFVVVNFQFGARNPAAVLRFDSNGVADAAPFLRGDTLNVAWGPDGLLYRVNVAGGVDAFDADTGALTPFIAKPVNLGGNGLVFGPDGNLYVSTSKSIDRYCGPRSIVCLPGTPAGAPGRRDAANPARYSFYAGFDLVFGPDGNLYVEGGGKVFRVCGPSNSRCAPGDYLGREVLGVPNATDPTIIDLPQQFFAGIAFGPDGNLYLTHSSTPNNLPVFDVVRFCGGPDNGARCAPIGNPEPQGNTFDAVFIAFPPNTAPPTGLDFGPNGELYILQNGIQRFSTTKCETGWCEPAAHPGAGLTGATLATEMPAGLSSPRYLKFPHALRVPPTPPAASALFVTNSQTHQVLRFDAVTGAPFPAPGEEGATFVPANRQGLSAPAGVVVGPDGNVYVASQPASILRFDGRTGEPAPAPGQSGADFVAGGGLAGPHGIAFGPDRNLYVASDQDVLRFDGLTGAPLPAPGRAGAVFAIANNATSLTFGPDGNLYTSAMDTHDPNRPFEIIRFDARSGERLQSVEQFGDEVSAINFGPDGNLYALETLTSSDDDRTSESMIRKFDGRSGAYLSAPGRTLGDFIHSAVFDFKGGMAFGSDGNIYVTAESKRVDKATEWGDNPKIPDAGTVWIARFDGITGTLLDPLVVGLSEGASFITFSPAATASATGTVFRDVAAPGNGVPFVEVQAAEEQPGGRFTCPIAAFFFLLCPSTTADALGNFVLTGLVPRRYELTAWPKQGLGYFPNRIVVDVPSVASPPLGPQTIVLLPASPIPAGVSVTPSRSVPVTGGEVPVATWNDSLTLSIPACQGGQYAITDASTRILAQGALVQKPDGTSQAVVDPLNPFKGSATVTMTCPGGPQTTSFLIYIDPSGRVVNDVTGQPIVGATVTLFRADTQQGPFVEVPEGSALMALSNRKNPDQTTASGAYGWDVVQGFYKVQASASGYTCDASNPPKGFTCVNDAVQSNVMAIPPAVTDLDLPLHPVTPPDTTPPALSLPASATLEATGPAGAAATFSVSAVDLVDGPVAVTCNAASPATFPLGTTTVTCSATDAHHNAATGAFTITVADTTPPVLSMPGDVSLTTSDARGAAASFVATAIDLVDGGITVACTPASGSLFPVGTTTVSCTAADRAGNKSTGTLRVMIALSIPIPPPGAPDGRMLGVGFIEEGGSHHHFAFRVLQTQGVDAGRFEYWANDGRRCRADDDDERDADRRDHYGVNGRFEATTMANVTFSDDPAFRPGRGPHAARPTVDTVRFSGAGKWNGKSGYTFEVLATDRGEPGRRRDTFSLVIRDSRGKTVVAVDGDLDGGNIQSTRLR